MDEETKPQPINLTARERDILREFIAERSMALREKDAAQRVAELAEGAMGALMAVIIERAGGNPRDPYKLADDQTALVLQEKKL